MPSVWSSALQLAAVSALRLVHAQDNRSANVGPPSRARGLALQQPVVLPVLFPLTSCDKPFDALSASPEQSLVFDISFGPGLDLTTADVALDGQPLPRNCLDGFCADDSVYVTLYTLDGIAHLVNASFSGIRGKHAFHRQDEETRTQDLSIKLNVLSNLSMPDPGCSAHDPSFTLSTYEEAGVRSWAVMHIYGPPDFSATPDDPMPSVDALPDSSLAVLPPNYSATPDDRMPLIDALPDSGLTVPLHLPPEYDLAGELESLRLLEQQAEELQAQINAKQRMISDNIRQHRDKLCLKDVIKECDGIVSAAKAILQRICQKVGIKTDSKSGFTQMESAQIAHVLALNAPSKKTSIHADPGMEAAFQKAFSLPTISEEEVADNDDDSSSSAFIQLARKQYRNPFVKIFSIIAAALGLTALVTFLRKRCMSMRKRVEHAADREERRNARAYRRAARRAIMRQHWDDLVAALNCFHLPSLSSRRQRPDARSMADYEERRALILQDAFLEQDLDLAEKGEVMEAELRELRHAQEIVSSLVRVDEHRFAVRAHPPPNYHLPPAVSDPPPPLVPLPYTPASCCRSRASSGTLPSYFSESLPDYSSRPEEYDFTDATSPSYSSSTDDHDSSSSSSISGRENDSSSVSADDGGGGGRGRAFSDVTPPSELSSSRHTTASSRFTPTSSIRDVSPRRISEETLRTMRSKRTKRT